MKIGILTYYGDLNCGTNLQAYATLLAMRNAYPDDEVEIIPFHGFKSRLLPYKSFRPCAIIRDIVRIRKYREFKKNCLNIHCDRTVTDVRQALDYIQGRRYDKIYVGADTLLELDRLPKSFDGLSAYWLKDVTAEKYMIAASAKNTEYQNLSAKQKDDMGEALRQFKRIAVRDNVTMRLCLNFGVNDKVSYVPDPTFVLDVDYAYTESYLAQKGIKIQDKTVYIQFWGSDLWVDDMIDRLHSAGYKVLVVRPNKKADYELNDIGPLEQLGLYRYVDFVITHRFHDCVFSLKNNTPFLVYVKDKSIMMTSDNESKQVSITKDFSLYPDAFLGSCDDLTWTECIVERISQVKSIWNADNIRRQLDAFKKRYLDYIELTK